jgi:hypothetical protein
MVVGDLDVERPWLVVGPLETHAPLLVAYQLGLTPSKLEYESLFHPEAAALPGW